MTENLRSMTPQLFEALIFLRLNEIFWNAQMVSTAINETRSEGTRARIEAHSLAGEQFHEKSDNSFE